MEHICHLQKDKKLATILGEQTFELKLRQNIALRLIASIMSQQLNTKVASIIYTRFLQIYNNQEPDPEQVLGTDSTTLRSIGLSNAKVKYVHNVAQFCVENKINDTMLLAMNNEEIIALLTQIKGVGRWTVEMLLMFTLGRQDVFPIDDLGIVQAMVKLYKISEEDKKIRKEKLLKISQKWSPYRTYACLYLWNWKDTK